jgi:hypothetical protein
MKRAVAIFLSLTVIWLQWLASAQTISLATAPQRAAVIACDCCVGKDVCRCCCVVPTAPATPPAPVLPPHARTTIDFIALLPQRIAWLLPDAIPARISSPGLLAASLSAVPLFRRDCALLI